MWRFYDDGRYRGAGLGGFKCKDALFGASEFGDGCVECHKK